MSKPQPRFKGWVNDPAKVEAVMNTLPFPVFGEIRSPIKDTGKGKEMLLYDIISKVAGKFPIRTQTIGDCVSMGAAYAIDAIKAVDIYLNKDFEEWVSETATEDIYGGSRVVIGQGQLGNDDGSLGAWIAKYINEYGTLTRKKYGNIDLSTYDGNRAKTWGSSGVPKELVAIEKEHKVITVSQVNTYEECRDLIVNGYGVTVASDQGFSEKRDDDGFSKIKGSWMHQMSILGVDDKYKRPGVLVQNSWGAWNGGPKRHNQPDGSFWVDAEVIGRMLSQGDSWAFSGYNGFKPQKLTTRII